MEDDNEIYDNNNNNDKYFLYNFIKLVDYHEN